MKCIEWCPHSPERHVHLESIKVTLFGVSASGDVTDLRSLVRGRPGLGWALNPMTSVLIKHQSGRRHPRGDDMNTEAETRVILDTKPRTPRTASHWLKAGKDTDRYPTQSLQKDQPFVHLDFRFPPFRLGNKSFLLFQAPQFVVICYNNPGNLTNQGLTFP